MNPERSNLFAALSKYGSTEEENYLTESFAFLLRMLCNDNPGEALKLFNSIAVPLPIHPLTDVNKVRLSTQKDLGEYGIVDMVFEEYDDTIIYIEIKHDSPLGPNQLESYFQALIRRGLPNSRLVLLKRHKDYDESIKLDRSQYNLITWYEIHKWLKAYKRDNKVVDYLINEFIFFLEEKNMKLRKVTWEYIQGLPALLEFRNMLEVARTEVMPKLHQKKTQGWSWVGLYIDHHFFFGVRYDKPLTVVYENNFGNYPTNAVSMDLEEKYFFSLNAEEQLNVLIEFLRNSSNHVVRGKIDSVPPERESVD